MIFVRSRAMLKMTMSSTMMIPPSEQPIAVDAERRNSTTPCTKVKYPSIPFGQKSAWKSRGGGGGVRELRRIAQTCAELRGPSHLALRGVRLDHRVEQRADRRVEPQVDLRLLHAGDELAELRVRRVLRPHEQVGRRALVRHEARARVVVGERDLVLGRSRDAERRGHVLPKRLPVVLDREIGAAGQEITATDLWTGVPQPVHKDHVGAVVPRHGVVLLRLLPRHVGTNASDTAG